MTLGVVNCVLGTAHAKEPPPTRRARSFADLVLTRRAGGRAAIFLICCSVSAGPRIADGIIAVRKSAGACESYWQRDRDTWRLSDISEISFQGFPLYQMAPG